MSHKVCRGPTRASAVKPGQNEQSESDPESAFAQRLVDDVTSGFSALGVALGSRLGLFDLMTTFTEPKTSEEIAAAAGYRERYVREWLGIMVCSNIIDLDESGKKYFIPKHRHRPLTHCGNAGVFSWCLPLLAGVNEDLMCCFKPDGPPGIAYSRYPYFHAWRDQRTTAYSDWTVLAEHFNKAPGLIEQLEAGIELCDMGTSTGRIPIAIAKKFPKSVAWGLDISEEAIAKAVVLSAEEKLTNTRFQTQDICDMPDTWSEKWDMVCMFDVAHDVPYTTKMFKEMLRVLKPGGYFVMLDIDVHTEHKDNAGNRGAGLVYSLSLFHCLPVSLNNEGSEGWGAAWGREKAAELLKQTGFEVLGIHEQLLAICKKPMTTCNL